MTPTMRFLSASTVGPTLILGLWVGLVRPAAAQTDVPAYDIVIADGRVIDPETNLDAIRNIGIRNGHIAAVTPAELTGKRTLDARGMVVAPGFIDLHSHGQNLVADRMHAFDGVTTALELESGILPIGEWYAVQAKTGRTINYGSSVAWTFARIQEFEKTPPRPDIAWFQQAFSRHHWVNDPATPQERESILQVIERGLKEGGLGIGVNAGYAPAGGFKELLEVHKLAARYQVPTFTHISCSNANDPKSSLECVGELIALATAASSHAHMCHLNSSSVKDVAAAAEMIRKAQARGVRITTEAYTYGAASTAVGAAPLSPESLRAMDSGPTALEYNGRRLEETSYSNLRARNPGAIVVWHFLDLPKDQALLDQSVLFPGGAIASDSMPWIDKATGRLLETEVWPPPAGAFAHPRSAGTFARLLAEWVRERKVLSILEAIRKSSLIPAQILEASVPQMTKKGRLQVGMDADVLAFDAATIQDRATYTQPAQPSVGMKHVLVNGVPVVIDGQLVRDARPGEPIRRNATNTH
jgi:N-acyl-D-glutamate deacylase